MSTTDNGTQTETSKAVEKVDHSPRAMVAQYKDSFAAVLPSHIKPETWVRIAQGALKKGRSAGNGMTELEVAATNNPAVFLSTLLDAARLGLEPGTEEYYLTPRKVSGRLEILGIVGYQGIVELIYRAGAVSSVIAECVYANDHFEYQPGVNPRPIHKIDWDADDRGPLRLVYSYAIMRDGATSKVVVLNRADIARIKSKSQGTDSKYSPWNTDEPAMWLKSAVRQLRKWVPTSSEYMREQLRAARDVVSEGPQPLPPRLDDDARSVGDIIDGDIIDGDDDPDGPGGGGADPDTGEIVDADSDVVDGEVVEPDGEPAQQPLAAAPEPEEEDEAAHTKAVASFAREVRKAFPGETRQDLAAIRSGLLLHVTSNRTADTAECTVAEVQRATTWANDVVQGRAEHYLDGDGIWRFRPVAAGKAS